ncbi:MAG: mycothione reductase [Acidimicrobiales bacterium]|jgi:mycothione reductase
MTDTFDLIIIGSGTGNSIPEDMSHMKIALVERSVFGGTCLNKGCIPSKMFVLPADIAHAAGDSSRLGLDTSFNGADWPAIRDRVFGRIDAIAAGGEDYRATGTPNVTLVRGTAVFEPNREDGNLVVHISDGLDQGSRLSAPVFLLAAGARPVMPLIDGLDQVRHHSSDSIMRLETFPERLGIVGGGFIAAEMGHVFSGLGSTVHMFNRSDRLLRAFDGEIAQRFTELFADRVEMHLGCVPESVEQRGDVIVLRCHDNGVGFEIEVDELLIATGRRPNSDLLDVDAVGIATHPDGRVVVDETMATSVPGVYALGDLSNSFQLKHLANAEGKVAFANIAHPDGPPQTMSYKAVPSAVFSHPQIATVGLTEEQATEQGIPYVVGKRDYGGTAYGWALVDETSFAKVMVDTETGLIVGAHIIGPQAASLIQPLIQAMQFDQTAADVATKVLYIHPALTEVVENALLEALS